MDDRKAIPKPVLPSNSVALCITGMHRSGTSLVASWLQACGLPIHEGNLIEGSVGNPRGHFEDGDFVYLQAAAVRARYPKSYGWKVWRPGFLFFDSDYVAQARDLARQRKAKYDAWGWKDPRTVLFLTEWKKIIPELRVLLLWRRCSDVVDSLIRRSRKADRRVFKVTFLQAVKLWVSYNEKACAYKRQFPDDTLLFSLDTVVGCDRVVLELIDRRLDMSLDYRPIDDLFDPVLLQRDSASLWVRLLSRLPRCARLERELLELSEDDCSDSGGASA